MRLFIAAGGKGKRLGHLAKDIPKPMVSVLGKPVLHHLIDWAKKNNISEVVMLNGYLSRKIVDYFKEGSEFGIKIIHSNETEPLDSGGAIRLAKKYVDGRFVYISGDHICEVNLNKMLTFHTHHKADMTFLVHKSSHPWDADLVTVGANGEVLKFVSKYEDHTGAGDLSNSGLCIIEPSIVELMDIEKFNFENYIYPRALLAGLNLRAYQSEEFMADMGTPERLKKCEDYLRSK
jgi:mannose-1-phosphate guanylyltransferase / phosphomannomutase